LREIDMMGSVLNDYDFDGFARRAAAEVSRRASLAALGTTGLAAVLAGPFTAEAKKGRKKDKKKKKCPECLECPAPVQATDLCPTQVAPCTAIMTIDCGKQPICPDLIACCSFLGTCDVNGFFVCLAQA
jgi:hypothetical protein